MSTNGAKKFTLKQHICIFLSGMKIYRALPKPMMLSTILSAVFEAAVPFINIYFAAQILNELAGTRNVERLILLVSLTIVLNLAGMLIQRAVSRWESYCSNRFWELGLKVLSDKALSMDFSDVENTQVQDKYSDIRNDQWFTGFGLMKLTETVKEMIRGIIRIALAATIAFSLFTQQVPYGSAYVWLNSPWIIVVVLLVFAGPVWLTPYLNVRGGRVWVEDAEVGKKVSAFFNHYFFNMYKDSSEAKDIRIYNQQEIIKAQIAKDPEWNWRNNQTWAKLGKAEGKFIAAGVAVTFLCNGILFLYVAIKAIAGAFDVGSLVLYVGSLIQFGMGLSAVMTAMGQIYNNNPFLAKWLEFLDIPNKMHQGNMKLSGLSEYKIEFRNVSFKYPKTEDYVLKKISLKLHIGERHAIVGENGSGKTTFVKLLCRLYDPTEGEILLNGIDIKNYDYDEYMTLFGVAFQDFELLPFTLGQNVATCVNYNEKRVKDALDSTGFSERLGEMSRGLDTYLYKQFEEDGVEISGGEAQKIALARAIYRDSPFLILDEPTAALDPIAEHEIYSSMNEIAGDKTAIFISHRLSSCRFCDNIAVFHKGELVQRGSHDNLVEDSGGKYHELWNAQAQYYQE